MSYSPLTPLEDRVAIVTGGARGIGLESAKALKENGAKVVIVDINAEAGEKAAKDLDADFVRTDLTNQKKSLNWQQKSDRSTAGSISRSITQESLLMPRRSNAPTKTGTRLSILTCTPFSIVAGNLAK